MVMEATGSPPKPVQKQPESLSDKAAAAVNEAGSALAALGNPTGDVERKSPEALTAASNKVATVMNAAGSLTQSAVPAKSSPSTSAAPALATGTTPVTLPGASQPSTSATTSTSIPAGVAATLAPQTLATAPAAPPAAATPSPAAAAAAVSEKAAASITAAQSAAVSAMSETAAAAQNTASSAVGKASAGAAAAQSTASSTVAKVSEAATAAQGAAVEKASAGASAAQAAAGSAAEKAGAAATAAQSTAAAAAEKAGAAASSAQAAAGSAAEKAGAAATAAQSTAAAAAEKAGAAASSAQAAAGSAVEKAGAAATAAQSTAAAAAEKAGAAASSAQAAAGSAVEKAGSLTQRMGSAMAETAAGTAAAGQTAASSAADKSAEVAAALQAAASPAKAPTAAASPAAPASATSFASRAASAISATPASAASAASQTLAAAGALADRAGSAVGAAPAAAASPIPAAPTTTEITATTGTPTPAAAAGTPSGAAPAAPASAAAASGPSMSAPSATPGSTTKAAPAPASATDRLKEQIMKEGPKIAADAAKQAGKAYVEAGKEASGTLKQLMGLRSKEGPPITLTVDQLATAAFLVAAALPLLALPLFMPPVLRLVYSLSWGLLIGLGLSYLYYSNMRTKKETNELLSINLGLKGLQQVVGSLPPMFSVSDSEKMEWLNMLVEEIWPFLDKAVCNMIKAEVEKIIPGVLKSLPPGMGGVINSIGFQHLTFGGAPFRVEGIWVDPNEKKALVMEVSIKWCGDPNITLAIGTPTGTVCPRVLDISLVASMRIKLSPLVDRLPGFVAAMVTMPRAPLIKYRLDFGKALGGAALPAAITPIINYFVREIISGMLVWPQRLVVPILQETQDDFFQAQLLMRRNCGLLRVCVVQIKEISKSDAGINDISVECSTEGLNYEATSVKAAAIPDPAHPNKLLPVNYLKWGEYLYLLVQEPRNQVMRLQAADYPRATTKADASAKARKDVIGRALVKMSHVTKAAEEADPSLAEEDAEIPVKVNLGKNDWGYPGGPGKGAGKLRLNMRYFPYEVLTREHMHSSEEAIVTCRLLKIRGITPTGTALTATCGIVTSDEKARGLDSRKTYTQTWTAARWDTKLKFRIKLVENALEAMGDEDDDDEDGDFDPAAPGSRKASVANLAATGAGPSEPATPTKAGAPPKTPKVVKPGALKEKKKAQRRKKQEELARLQRELAAGPVTELDYTLDASNLHAMHHVRPTYVNKEGQEVDNCVLITVKDNKKQLVAKASVPVKLIRDSTGFNPITGKLEYGALVQPWDDNVPGKPGERIDDELQWGMPMEGNSDRIRLWAIFRYVPYIPGPVVDFQDDEEEEQIAAILPPKGPVEEVVEAVGAAGEKVTAEIKEVVQKVEAGIMGGNPTGDANGTQLKGAA